ncbi:TPA: hypothetical protein ACH9QA_000566, partial [Escherichia coli]
INLTQCSEKMIITQCYNKHCYHVVDERHISFIVYYFNLYYCGCMKENTSADGTKLRHKRPHNGLQGFTCFDVVGRVSAVLMG